MATLQPEDRIEITRRRIAKADVAAQIRSDADGAVATFDGCVRNLSHGRATLYLEYEAYEAMALAKMNEIAAQVHKKFSKKQVAMVHRQERLENGENNVFMAVGPPNRAAAFDACRYAIDTLKKT